MSKRFHLGDILTITDGRFVAPRGMEAVYEIMNYMTGESLFTHQLVRAAPICRAALLEQFPQLADLVEPDTELNVATVPAWLDKQAAKFGAWHDVEPLQPGAYRPRDAIAELLDYFPPERIAIIDGGRS
jgi:hypothetical protein